jgi:hypothetical protein
MMMMMMNDNDDVCLNIWLFSQRFWLKLATKHAKSKVKLSRYTPWGRLGGEEV